MKFSSPLLSSLLLLPAITAATDDLKVNVDSTQTGGRISFNVTATGGTEPYRFDGSFTAPSSLSSKLQIVDGLFLLEIYEPMEKERIITFTVTDADDKAVEVNRTVAVTKFAAPNKPEAASLRFATYNTAFSDIVNRKQGRLAEFMATGNNTKIQDVSYILQDINADVLLLNEYDHEWDDSHNFNMEKTIESVNNFIKNYLEVAQGDDVAAVSYPHIFVAPCNTGMYYECVCSK